MRAFTSCLLLLAVFGQAMAFAGDLKQPSSRVQTTCIVQSMVNQLTANLSGKPLLVRFPGTTGPVSIVLGQRLGRGLGATVYVAHSSHFDGQALAASGVVAKMSHTPRWRSGTRTFKYLNSILDDEYRQFNDLRASIPALRQDPQFPRDFGWQNNPGRLPVAEILDVGQLEDGNTILFKQRIRGSSLAEIKAKYGEELPPEMLNGLQGIYDLSQALYRSAKTNGHPFMLDIYPSNLIWVEKPEDLKIMGLRRPAFVMPEASNMKKPLFQENYSFEQFVNDYKKFLKLGDQAR